MKRKALEEIEGQQRRTYNVFTLHQIEKEERNRLCVQMTISRIQEFTKEDNQTRPLPH